MRFEFRFAMEGYGKNTKEALEYALEQALARLDEFDFEAIEKAEIISIEDDE